jgi:hypothetical protein
VKKRFIKWLLARPAVRAWLLYSAAARPSAFEVEWTKDDARALEGFLTTGTGRKLALLLENKKADADAQAVLLSTAGNAMEKIGIARGVRAAVGELKRLTAVRQNPDNHETAADSLPPDLEHLRET